MSKPKLPLSCFHGHFDPESTANLTKPKPFPPFEKRFGEISQFSPAGYASAMQAILYIKLAEEGSIAEKQATLMKANGTPNQHFRCDRC